MLMMFETDERDSTHILIKSKYILTNKLVGSFWLIGYGLVSGGKKGKE